MTNEEYQKVQNFTRMINISLLVKELQPKSEWGINGEDYLKLRKIVGKM